jgi:ABC-type Mn2+/Zn2+ transport system permease subunit
MRWLAYYAVAGATCGLLGLLATGPMSALALGCLAAFSFALLEGTQRLRSENAIGGLYALLLGGGAAASGSYALEVSGLSAALTGSVLLPVIWGTTTLRRARRRA